MVTFTSLSCIHVLVLPLKSLLSIPSSPALYRPLLFSVTSEFSWFANDLARDVLVHFSNTVLRYALYTSLYAYSTRTNGSAVVARARLDPINDIDSLLPSNSSIM